MVRNSSGESWFYLLTSKDSYRRGPEYATPKYTSLAHWLFYIKGIWKIANARTFWLSPPTLPRWKQEIENLPEGYINKPCHFFTNLLTQAQTPLSCQFFTYLLYLCLVGIKDSFVGHFFEFYIFMGLPYYKICFSPVNLFHVNLFIRTAKEPREEKKGNLSSSKLHSFPHSIIPFKRYSKMFKPVV